MKSVRDEMQSMKKSAKEVELYHSSTSASKPGPIKQSDNLSPNSDWADSELYHLGPVVAAQQTHQ